MWRCMRIAVVVGLLVLVRGGRAEDAFYQVPWSELELSEGTLPGQEEGTWRNWQLRSQKPPYAILDGEGEVYVSDDASPHRRRPGRSAGRRAADGAADRWSCALPLRAM